METLLLVMSLSPKWQVLRVKIIVIINNSPLFFSWYLPANTELSNVTDIIKYAQLTKILKLQKYRKHTWK